MQVHVEFYGIPRTRAGRSILTVSTRDGGTLAEVCSEVARQLPQFGEACLDGDRLRAGYLACIEGREFTTNPHAPLTNGACVMILSADVGG